MGEWHCVFHVRNQPYGLRHFVMFHSLHGPCNKNLPQTTSVTCFHQRLLVIGDSKKLISSTWVVCISFLFIENPQKFGVFSMLSTTSRWFAMACRMVWKNPLAPRNSLRPKWIMWSRSRVLLSKTSSERYFSMKEKFRCEGSRIIRWWQLKYWTFYLSFNIEEFAGWCTKWESMARWWQRTYFWNFHPDPWGKKSQFDKHIFQTGLKSPIRGFVCSIFVGETN